MDSQSLGSPPAMDLLRYLKPLYWFSAHLHVKFPALYEHDKGQSSSGEVKSSNCRQFTKFLSLDKCLPRRSYLQIVDVTMDTVEEGPYKLTYDPEWLAILRSTEQLMCYDNSRWMEPFGKWQVKLIVQFILLLLHYCYCYSKASVRQCLVSGLGITLPLVREGGYHYSLL